MKRGSVFRIPHIQEVYPMPYSTFCISHIETWDGFGRGKAGLMCGANVRGSDLLSSTAVAGKCRATDITQIYPLEFTIIKDRDMTLSKSPEYRAFSRAEMEVVTNDWCIILVQFLMRCLPCL